LKKIVFPCLSLEIRCFEESFFIAVELMVFVLQVVACAGGAERIKNGMAFVYSVLK
jgi:hypothetical protein